MVKIAERVNRTSSLQDELKKKYIVQNTEKSFRICKTGTNYDDPCLGTRMGILQAYIGRLQTDN